MTLEQEILSAIDAAGTSSVRIITRKIAEFRKQNDNEWQAVAQQNWAILSTDRVRSCLLRMEARGIVIRESAHQGGRHWWKRTPLTEQERSTLVRLADGDAIVFSQDGDYAWFSGGDRAFVEGEVITLRDKGFTKRIVTDEENYRGMSEEDVISDSGLAVLEINR